MAVAKKIKEYASKSSWIRKMFEEGGRLKQLYGDANVFDYTIGNPLIEPPAAVKATLARLTAEPLPGMHRYMSNAGYSETRRAVATHLSREFNLPFTAEHIVMTAGAACGANIALKAILDEGDEVIINTPYFVEYLFYVENHSGVPVIVKSKPDFMLDPKAIEAAITPRTKAILINSPNNPSGVIYDAQTLTALSQVSRAAQLKFGHEIYIISDDPYRKIVFDGHPCPNIINYYENSIVLYSHSKDLALPGERIGYLALNPLAAAAHELMDAIVFCMRTLGFVNAPALQQRVVQECLEVSVDVEFYQQKRDLICQALRDYGYSFVNPTGTFYIFPQSPISDDVAFIQKALAKKLLLVPGSGFGTPGYFRISYCTVDDQTIARSLPLFKELMEESRS